MTKEISQEEVIREFLEAINENNAAIFAGAGLSCSSGYVDWKHLLKDIAKDIGLDVNKESDLISVAQYYKNERGHRGNINQLLINKFTATVSENENLKILSSLPISTYWTTNYDKLIEKHLSAAGKIVDVKIYQEQLAFTMPNKDVIIYKMHGDIEHPHKAIIVKDDYESYNLSHSLFSTALQGDLISKTFLFIGLSFEDPNLNSILARIRVLISENQRSHYCIMKRILKDDYSSNEQFEYDEKKQSLRINDLLRYSINTVLVDDYSDITKLLNKIYLKYMSKRVFISGSAHTYGAIQNPHVLMTKLAKALIKNNYHITTGFGKGVGGMIISGAFDEIMNNRNMNVERYLTMRPKPSFDLNSKNENNLQKIYHNSMVTTCGVVIFIFGNKLNDNNELINSPGVLHEFKIALENNKKIIPLGISGYSSKEILEYVLENIDDFEYLKNYIDVLTNETNFDIIIDSVIKILKEIY